MSGTGSAEKPGILQVHAHGCVESSRGLEDPKLPLSVPTGVQLAPTSPKLVEGELCELPLYGVLRSSYDPHRLSQPVLRLTAKVRLFRGSAVVPTILSLLSRAPKGRPRCTLPDTKELLSAWC
jgi:hypothetical protein